MSTYVNFDHAGWVENHNASMNSIYSKRKRYKPAPEKLSDFQTKVINILGIVGKGIYNAPIGWESIDWDMSGDGKGMSVVWKYGLATFDYADLTMLVFLCHEARIRLSIEPAMRNLRLTFFQRQDDGSLWQRHPNLSQAVDGFRQWFPEYHLINYRKESAE